MPIFKYKFTCKVTDATLYVYAGSPGIATRVMGVLVKNPNEWREAEADKEQAKATCRAKVIR